MTLARSFSLNLGKNASQSTGGSKVARTNLNSALSVCLFPNLRNLSARADIQSSKDAQQEWFKRASSTVTAEYDENAVFQMFMEVVEAMVAM